MPSYRARTPIYLNRENRLVETGEVFSSDERPGLAGIPLETAPPQAGAPVARRSPPPHR